MYIKQLSLLRDALHVRSAHRRGLFRQAAEIMRFKRQNPTLGTTDYFAFRLYDPQVIKMCGPKGFLGWRAEQDLARALNVQTVSMPAWDKASFAVIAHAYGLPVPRLHALYRPGMPAINGCTESTLDSPDALIRWLRTQAPWPLFAKPSCGEQVHGCYAFTRHDPETDALISRNGSTMPIDEFVSTVVERTSGPYYQREMGYLFQEVLRPHALIAELLGNRAISCARVVVAHDETGAEIVSAVWKIARRENDTDHFRGGATGNLVGEIDLENGRISRVVDGFGPRAKYLPRHPDTRCSFDQFIMPEWPKVIALCRRAATAFPLLRIQHWDIAVTDRGPVILELNNTGAIGFLQFNGRGLLTEKVRGLLREHATMSTFAWLRERDY